MQRSTVVCLGEALVLVPALPTAGTIPEPGSAHLAGAGDAFAAGLLTRLVQGEPLPRCLPRGHLSAAAMLTVRADSPVPPSVGRGDALLDAPARDWATIKAGPRGFAGPVTVGGGGARP